MKFNNLIKIYEDEIFKAASKEESNERLKIVYKAENESLLKHFNDNNINRGDYVIRETDFNPINIDLYKYIYWFKDVNKENPVLSNVFYYCYQSPFDLPQDIKKKKNNLSWKKLSTDQIIYTFIRLFDGQNLIKLNKSEFEKWLKE